MNPVMMARIVPTGVAVAETNHDLDDDELALDDVAFPEEVRAIAAAVEPRRHEFLTTRDCARRAMRQLGIAPVAIPRATNRAPLWPDGVVGSLTHCAGYRAAAVGLVGQTVMMDQVDHEGLGSWHGQAEAGGSAGSERAQVGAEPGPTTRGAQVGAELGDTTEGALRTIGIDAEPAGPLRPGVMERITSADERAALARLTGATPSWDRLLFSAKESIFKAWSPVTGTGLDFSGAEVWFGLDGRFGFRFTIPVPEVIDALTWSGRWRADEKYVMTSVVGYSPEQ